MDDAENKLENEILVLKNTLQNYEDTDPAYMNEEMRELRHYVSYTHMRMEESLGFLITKNMLAPLGSASIPQDTYRQVFSSGTTIAIEVDFSRKVSLASSCGAIQGTVVSLMHQVNNLRKYFAHPSKFQGELDKLTRDRTAYKSALSQLVDTHREMNKVFEKFLPAQL